MQERKDWTWGEVLTTLAVLCWMVITFLLGYKLLQDWSNTDNLLVAFAAWVVWTTILVLIGTFVVQAQSVGEDGLTMSTRRELIAPLIKELMPLKNQMDSMGVPLCDRTIQLAPGNWPLQHKANIRLVLGIKIIWIGEEKTDG